MQRLRRLLTLGLVTLLAACSTEPPPATLAEQFTLSWFTQAHQDVRGEHLCHALGLLKHPQFTCDELLDHAADIIPDSRELVSITPRECIGDVCGDFFELTFRSHTKNGADSEEIALVKRDDGVFRLYWYRSTSLLALLQPANAQTPGEKSPEQAAYSALTERYPGLYQFPPCYDIRVSSSNLMGELAAAEQLDPVQVEQAAATCGPSFCLAFVGRKVASVCP
ncbi:MAG: hypothetical protein AAF993_06990 [Pseudomonadota bacterium]